MCTDNCGWVITAARPQAKQDPVFETDFLSHMKGTLVGGSHTGCHSLYGKNRATIKFEQTKNDANQDIDKKVFAPGCSKIYSAKISLSKSVDRRGQHEFGEEKLSSFWPDDMCLECVKQAIIYAWKFNKAVSAGGAKHNSQSVQLSKVQGIAAWAGQVNIKKNQDSFRIWVGSPEEGTPGSKIYSAYPKIGARFF